MKITLYRDDFKNTLNPLSAVSSFDLMLKAQFGIKTDTRDIDSIDIDVDIDTLKTF